MRMTSKQREALWAFLSGPPADEATTAAAVYPQAVLGPAVAQAPIVKRPIPSLLALVDPKRKRKRKRVRVEALFPHSAGSR